MHIVYKNGKYTVGGLDFTKLEHIPGAKQPVMGVLEGFLDAVSVAMVRHGQPALTETDPRQHSTPSDFRPYQTYGVDWLVQHLKSSHGAILADDPGLGKSVQTIQTWACMGKPAPLLIVCPASVRRTWRAQFAKWHPSVVPMLLESGKDVEKLAGLAKLNSADTPQVVVTGYQLAQRLVATQFRPRMLVLDECHVLRGRTTKTTHAFWQLGAMVNYKLGLTGTPMWGRVRDMWALLKVLFGYRFGSAEEFDYAYCNAVINSWGGRDNKGESRGDELALRLKYYMLRRTKQEVKEFLPAVTRVKRYVPASKEAQYFLKRFITKQTTFANALISTLDGKLAATLEAALECPVNALIFTWRKTDVAAIEDLLVQSGKSVVTLTGDLSDAQREKVILAAAKANPKPYVVATIDSVGTGVDGLQFVTSNVIYHTLDPSPNKTIQSESRVFRQGQPDPVLVQYVVMEDSADCFVEDLVLDKLAQWQTVMGTDDAESIKRTLQGDATKEGEEAALDAIFAAFAGDGNYN